MRRVFTIWTMVHPAWATTQCPTRVAWAKCLNNKKKALVDCWARDKIMLLIMTLNRSCQAWVNRVLFLQSPMQLKHLDWMTQPVFFCWICVTQKSMNFGGLKKHSITQHLTSVVTRSFQSYTDSKIKPTNWSSFIWVMNAKEQRQPLWWLRKVTKMCSCFLEALTSLMKNSMTWLKAEMCQRPRVK